MNLSRVSLAVLALSFVSLSALLGACHDKPSSAVLPDPVYLYVDGDTTLPEGATSISNEEFAERYANGSLLIAGPEATRQSEEGEAAQDAEDLALIDSYQKANPNSPNMLPELTPVTDGSAELEGSSSGNLQIKISKRGQKTPDVHTAMGQRFRIRSLAKSIRLFNTKENQLAIYQKYLENISPQDQAQLGMDTFANVSKLTTDQIRDINNQIAQNWTWLIPAPPPFSPVLPPVCASNTGNNPAYSGDQVGNRCDYATDGVMKNFNWSGKNHITCVKNQAARGSCPAFSTISAIEYQVHKKYGEYVNLSEQDYYARLKASWPPDGPQNLGDGSWPAWGINESFNRDYPIPFEIQWDYNPALVRQNIMGPGADTMLGTMDDTLDGYRNSCLGGYPTSETCSDTTHQTQFVCTGVAPIGVWCGFVHPDVNPDGAGYKMASGTIQYWDPARRDLSVAKAILAVGLFRSPTVWGFDVQTSSFGVNASGFVTHVASDEHARIGGHAVHMVGLISNAQLAAILPGAPAGSGGGYFIIKNSWNNCWGDGGFGYIPYDSVRDYTLELSSTPNVR